MLLPYFLRVDNDSLLFDRALPWGSADLKHGDMTNTIEKYRLLRKKGAKIPPDIQRFMDDLHDSLINGTFKMPPQRLRAKDANSEDQLTLTLTTWYLYELDPRFCDLSKGTDAKTEKCPAWEAVKSYLYELYGELLPSKRDTISFVGGESKLRGCKKRVENTEDIFHKENSQYADNANLRSLRFALGQLGVPESELRAECCKALKHWKKKAGLADSTDSAHIDSEALENVFPPPIT